MKKRMLVFLMVAVIALSVVLTACNKDVYVDPSTSEKYVLVTDENGKKVLSEDGELLVYATDENGKKVKDDNGEYVTEIQGFVGQIEEDGVVEDYAYYFTLPEGWKAVSDRGEFQNKHKGITLKIKIKEDTFNDYYTIARTIYDGVIASNSTGTTQVECDWAELDYSGLSSKLYILSVKSGQDLSQDMFFVQDGNLYGFLLKGETTMSIEEGKKELLTILDAIEFKPYAYYEGLTDSLTFYQGTTIEETEAK